MTNLSLAGALNALDVNRDDDWTNGGDPLMKRIHELMGTNDTTRADVEAMTPHGFNRSNAHAASSFQEVDNGTASDPETTSETPSADAGAEASQMGGETGAANNEANENVGLTRSSASMAVEECLSGCFDGRDFDAICLIEAVVAAAQSDRYMRNSALQSLVHGYQASQGQIKEVQGRLDARIADRAKKNAISRAKTADEEEYDIPA